MPLPHQAHAALLYQALLYLGTALYVTPEAAHSAQRRDPLIAASVLVPVTVLTKARYLRRWARRLRQFGFGREDSVILAYGSFGVDLGRRRFGSEAIVSADQPLVRRFHEQQEAIAQRFQRMTRQLGPPYSLAQLPTLMSTDDMLRRLAV